jgi:hypothetical protein
MPRPSTFITPQEQTLISRAALKRKAADRREADMLRLRQEADEMEAEYWAWRGKQAAALAAER